MVKPIDFKLYFTENGKLALKLIQNGMTHQQSMRKIITSKYETEVNKWDYPVFFFI